MNIYCTLMICQHNIFEATALALGKYFKDQLNLFILQKRKPRLSKVT